MSINLKKILIFSSIAQAKLRPDIVLSSEKINPIVMIELLAPVKPVVVRPGR